MTEIILHISNRKIQNMAAFKAALADLKDGKHLITIKDFRKRSIQQNRYYWGVVVPMCRKGLFDIGYDEVQNDTDAHEILKMVHLRKRMVSKQTGEVIDISGRSATLTIPEFNDYIERICKWAAEYLGIVIPSPNEEFAMFQEKVEEWD